MIIEFRLSFFILKYSWQNFSTN